MIESRPWIGKEVRVKFDLEVSDGYPPITAEFLIGVLESPGVVRLDNTPFFAAGVALGDIVKCTGSPPHMAFSSLIKESGYKAIAIIFIDNECKAQLFLFFKSLGCYIEAGKFPEYDMLAIAVSPSLNYISIKKELDGLEEEGKISFAELCM